MLDSNVKQISKYSETPTVAFNAKATTGYSDVIPVKGYRQVLIHVTGTFTGLTMTAPIEKNSAIVNYTPRITGYFNNKEVTAITAAGLYYVDVRNMDVLFLRVTAIASGSVSATVTPTLQGKADSVIARGFVEEEQVLCTSKTDTGYTNGAVSYVGVNTAIVYITGSGTFNITARTYDNNDTAISADKIYNAKFEQLDAITAAGLYYVCMKGKYTLELSVTSNTGSITAKCRLSAIEIPISIVNNERMTIMSAVSSNGYSNDVVINKRYRMLLVNVTGNFNGRLSFGGNYSSGGTNMALKTYRDDGFVTDYIYKAGLYFVPIVGMEVIWGRLENNTSGSVTVLGQLSESASLPVANDGQSGGNNYAVTTLQATTLLNQYDVNATSKYKKHSFRNLSSCAPVMIEVTDDYYNAPRMLRVDPGEVLEVATSHLRYIQYCTLVGTAEIEVVSGDVRLQRNGSRNIVTKYRADGVRNKYVLDVKGSYIIYRDYTTALKLIVTKDAGVTTHKEFTFGSGQTITEAFITRDGSVIAAVQNNDSTFTFYRVVDAFTSATATATAITSLNSAAAYGWWYGQGIHQDLVGNIMFAEYFSPTSTNNMRVFRSTDDGATWSVALNFAHKRDTYIDYEISAVNTGTKTLTVAGDKTALLTAGQAFYVRDVNLGTMLTIASISYNEGAEGTEIVCNEVVSNSFVGKCVYGIRHFHCCRYNYFNKTWYITSGDEEWESIWLKSTDHGQSFSYIKETGFDYKYKTAALAFDGNGYAYFGLDTALGYSGVHKCKLSDMSVESIFCSQGVVGCLDITENTLIIATGYPASSRYRNGVAEIYVSNDLGKTWDKAFWWESSGGSTQSYIDMIFGRDSRNRYYFNIEGAKGQKLAPNNVTQVIIQL